MLKQVDLSLLAVDQVLLAVKVDLHCTALFFTHRHREIVKLHTSRSLANRLATDGITELRHGKLILLLLLLMTLAMYRSYRRRTVCKRQRMVLLLLLLQIGTRRHLSFALMTRLNKFLYLRYLSLQLQELFSTHTCTLLLRLKHWLAIA